MKDKTPLAIEEIHDMAFEIMKDIDRFCRENDIPYTIAAGSLLGAVRHGGFIPWDDDSDIFMLRKDFDRFINTYKSDKYKLVFNFNPEEKLMANGFAKVADMTTHQFDSTGRLDYGVWVDIFPLESVPEDPEECHKFMHKIMSINNRMYHRRRKDIISILKSYRHSFSWWINRLDQVVHNNPYEDSPLVAQAIGADNYRTVIPRAWFKSLKNIKFRDHEFLAFSDTDAYLSMLYGSDYMTPKKWSHNAKIYKNEN